MGIHVGEHIISLDAKEKSANLNFVSHAHSDHTAAVNRKNTILCSDITKDLVEARVCFGINNVVEPKNLRMLNAGHMLGSKQLRIEADGCSIVYTGDYQMQKSPVAEKIEIEHADVLIIDSTYPYANVVFEEKEEVITSIQHYLKSRMDIATTMFSAYSMGKSQELVRICNDIGICPLVDPHVAKISKVYSKHGVKLDFVERNFAEGMTEGDFKEPVWIVSSSKAETVKGMVSSMNNRIFTAVATGFARMQKFNTDVQFALSDHADFKQAVDYIGQCSPKAIYTRGSGCEAFARNLKAHGYNASVFQPRLNLAGLLLNHI